MLVNPLTIKPMQVSGSVNSPQPLKSWQVGQIVKAQVVGTVQNGQATLQIAGQQITARTIMPLSAGQELQLQVTKAQQQDQIILQLLNHNNMKAAIQQGFREALPKQASMTPLLSNLFKLTKQSDKKPLSDKTMSLVKNLTDSIPTAKQLSTPQGVKKAITNSGILLEANLAKKDSNSETKISSDIKGNLLKLIDQTKSEQAQNPVKKELSTASTYNKITSKKATPMPTTNINLDSTQKLESLLLRQLVSSIAKIQLNQLQSLNIDKSDNTILQCELAVESDESCDCFELTIEREEIDDDDETVSNKNLDEDQYQLGVTINFNFQELGGIDAKLFLHNNSVKTTFWANNPDTLHSIQQEQERLQQCFKKAGLESQDIHCYLGRKQQKLPAMPNSPLLDEKT